MATYVTAAFRSVDYNQAYIFMKKEYILDNIAPLFQKDDEILQGPTLVGDAFSSLRNTIFTTQGIDCAFASHNEGCAYIFSGKMCVNWWYRKNKIIENIKPISQMFPFLKNTVFENGLDAAFESLSRPYEAHIFKGNFYACINYSYPNGHIITIDPIYHKWDCLRGTTYENGFDAAFAIDIGSPHEAYLFKGDSLAHIKFTPCLKYQKVVWSGKIKDKLKSLGSILPRK